MFTCTLEGVAIEDSIRAVATRAVLLMRFMEGDVRVYVLQRDLIRYDVRCASLQGVQRGDYGNIGSF